MINNAGILRDVSLIKMTDLDWGWWLYLDALRFPMQLLNCATNGFRSHLQSARERCVLGHQGCLATYEEAELWQNHCHLFECCHLWKLWSDKLCSRWVISCYQAKISRFYKALFTFASAKSALIGFSNSLAQEGAKHNIVANTLIPTAGSRLTQTVLPEVEFELFRGFKG